MNANNTVIDNTFISIAENVTGRAAMIRLVLASIIFGMLFIEPATLYLSAEHMMLLVVPGIYLFTTAILRWDPVFALLGLSLKQDELSFFVEKNEGCIAKKAGSEKRNAANDAGTGLKQTG